MTLTIAAVTVWSAYDGHRSPGMMAAAAVAAVAAMNVLAYAAAVLPQTRLLSALFSGLWVLLFMPGWDWLAGQYAYPATWWSAATFAVVFGALRYAMTRN